MKYASVAFIAGVFLIGLATCLFAGETEVIKYIGTFPLDVEAAGEGRGVSSMFFSPEGKELSLLTTDPTSCCIVGAKPVEGRVSGKFVSREQAKWNDGSNVDFPIERPRLTSSQRLQLMGKGLLKTATEEAYRGDVCFEDAYGNTLRPGEHLWSVLGPPNEQGEFVGAGGGARLFWVQQGKRVEITSPDYLHAHNFQYDHDTRRVCARVGGGQDSSLIYSLDEGPLHQIPAFDADVRASIECYIVPGRDYLILLKRFLDEKGNDYERMTLHLSDLSGNVVADIPLRDVDDGSRVEPVLVETSRTHLAVRVQYTQAGKRKDEIRLFEIPEQDAQ